MGGLSFLVLNFFFVDTRQMNYYAQVAVDDSNHVITAAGADFAEEHIR
jgi:hypothetical protein